jgi:hypothetical protein
VNGPEHYKEAERFLAKVTETIATGTTDTADLEAIANALAAAQAHATLALAAATVARMQTREYDFEDANYRTGRESMTEPDSHEWGIAQGREGS